METRKLVGWNVRRLRTARSWSIEELAGEAEIDASYLARIERSRVNSSIDVLTRVVNALQVPIAEIFIEPKAGSSPPAPLAAGRKKKAARRATLKRNRA